MLKIFENTVILLIVLNVNVYFVECFTLRGQEEIPYPLWIPGDHKLVKKNSEAANVPPQKLEAEKHQNNGLHPQISPIFYPPNVYYPNSNGLFHPPQYVPQIINPNRHNFPGVQIPFSHLPINAYQPLNSFPFPQPHHTFISPHPQNPIINGFSPPTNGNFGHPQPVNGHGWPTQRIHQNGHRQPWMPTAINPFQRQIPGQYPYFQNQGSNCCGGGPYSVHYYPVEEDDDDCDGDDQKHPPVYHRMGAPGNTQTPLKIDLWQNGNRQNSQHPFLFHSVTSHSGNELTKENENSKTKISISDGKVNFNSGENEVNISPRLEESKEKEISDSDEDNNSDDKDEEAVVDELVEVEVDEDDNEDKGYDDYQY